MLTWKFSVIYNSDGISFPTIYNIQLVFVCTIKRWVCRRSAEENCVKWNLNNLGKLTVLMLLCIENSTSIWCLEILKQHSSVAYNKQFLILIRTDNILYSKWKSEFQLSSSVQLITLGLKGPQADVPSEWITSGALVEYEVLGDCPKHNSIAACHDATTSSSKCLWCEKANACITSNDKDVHDFKVNRCQNQNMTTDTIEDTGERKSPQYVYIVVPLVISFLIVCIGCGIWLWFHRRKRVYP
ncbi:unnamed protein product [Schistosoma margrebowiei]|uniref:Uncharacterized protein n=1 Tax=Schistosoma margrebowiei TaxID=48269 RepID=A0A183N4T1_9TREM|nr:unnamed protein product [Schistosoma margrebowiei]